MTETALPDDARRPAHRRRLPRRPHPSRPAFPPLGPAAFPLLLAVLASAGCGCKPDRAALAPAVPPPATPASAPAALERSADGKPVVVLSLGGQPFKLEVVASDADRNRGLMYRRSMPADAGMIFVFAQEKPLQFWMRNTLLPLDIAYLDAGGRVVSVKPMRPLDETGVPSDRPARFAIELNQGTATRVGLKVGDVIDLPPAVRSPPDVE